MPKSGSHIGRHKSLFNGDALFKGLHRPIGPVCESTTIQRLGSKAPSSRGPQGPSARNARPNGTMERSDLPRSHHSAGAPFGLLSRSLGWRGYYHRSPSAGLLERPQRSPHQREGVRGSNKYSAIPCTPKGTRVPQSGQLSDICILVQRGRKNPQPKRPSASIFKVVHGKENIFGHNFGEECRRPSRRPQSKGPRPWGLYPRPKSFQTITTEVQAPHPPPSGYVCLPRQPPTATLRGKIPTLASHGSGRPKMSFGQFPKLLCQPTLENNFQVATQATPKQTSKLPNGGPLLGFQCLVAPTCEAARTTQPSVRDTSLLGDVQELLGRIHATAQVAPDLCAIIRQSLQRKQVSSEATTAFLKSKTCLPRYARAFKLFWAYATIKGASATSGTLATIAGLLLEFDKLLPQHSKQAYAALLLIPDLEQLTFQPLLKAIKRNWNTAQVRYAAFYDAALPLERLGCQKLNWSSPEDLRTRLILVLRFLMLCRSIDLERLYRAVSFVGETPYVLIRRKGQLQAQWEALVQVHSAPHLCPWQLLQAYVALTHTCIREGSEVFITTKPPFRPLKANSIGSLTRQALKKLGVNTQLWKPHSTRGAGVTMFKKLGFSSEEVCEIGKWKNVAAFTSHYLRLGAAQKVGQAIHSLVHRVSPFRSAEPDLPRTAGTKDPAGRGKEGEAQDNGEPALPSQDVASSSSGDLALDVSGGENAANSNTPLEMFHFGGDWQHDALTSGSDHMCPMRGRATRSRRMVRRDWKPRKTVGPPTDQKSRNSAHTPTGGNPRNCAGPPYARFARNKKTAPKAVLKTALSREAVASPQATSQIAILSPMEPEWPRKMPRKRARSAHAPHRGEMPSKRRAVLQENALVAFTFAAQRNQGDHQPPPRSDEENEEE